MFFSKQIEEMYRKNLFVRQDNPGEIFYFGPEDFLGLQAHPYGFRAKAGHELNGFFYHYADPVPGKLVVFDHGMGNGHRAYMREIQQLCKAGYLVFSYDHTGCMSSGGESTGGFATSLSDLDACIHALKQEEALKDRKIAAVGHSWGGFSVMNITALHPEITHVVAMSGFISVEKIVSQNFSGLLKGYRKMIMDLERKANPDYVDFCAVKTLRTTNARVLLISSDDDAVVKPEQHFYELQQMLGGRENISFLTVHGKNHNPSYTDQAVKYKDAFFAVYRKEEKKLTTSQARKAFMAGYDWWYMTEQDEAVWERILDHLKT